MIKIIVLLSFLFSPFVHAEGKKIVDEKLKKEALVILEMNESLHASFFGYKGSEVENEAKKIVNSINKITHPELKKLLTFSKGRLEAIKANRDREENNKSYNMFSMALIYIMNTYDLGDKYQGYRCPMVRKQWVQNSKKQAKVHNPYAESMPHCGEQLKK